MNFRTIQSLFVRPRLTSSRRDRKVSLAVESVERRLSLSGVAAGAALVHEFNPQPDPPSSLVRIIAI